MLDDDLLNFFRKADTSTFLDFHSLASLLEKALWVLLVSKDLKIAKQLTAEQIALVIRDVYEVSVEPRAITNALNKAGRKIHSHREKGGIVFYEIMKPGKDLLISEQDSTIALYYFEPNKQFSSKRLLSSKLLDNLTGILKIVDPYCGDRALDIIHGKNRKIQFLTRLDNLNQGDRARLIREINDFKIENSSVELRDYKNSDVHDRYIISDNALVLLGYSMKSLGGKESFAIVLNKDYNQNIFDAMLENFNRRWKASTII